VVFDAREQAALAQFVVMSTLGVVSPPATLTEVDDAVAPALEPLVVEPIAVAPLIDGDR
jgi:hypothetical protein